MNMLIKIPYNFSNAEVAGAKITASGILDCQHRAIFNGTFYYGTTNKYILDQTEESPFKTMDISAELVD